MRCMTRSARRSGQSSDLRQKHSSEQSSVIKVCCPKGNVDEFGMASPDLACHEIHLQWRLVNVTVNPRNLPLVESNGRLA